MTQGRRTFLAAACAGAVASQAAPARNGTASSTLALLGGKPVRSSAFPSWPVVADSDEKAWSAVLRSRRWNRLGGSQVERFESAWAGRLGARQVRHRSSDSSVSPSWMSPQNVRVWRLVDTPQPADPVGGTGRSRPVDRAESARSPQPCQL